MEEETWLHQNLPNFTYCRDQFIHLQLQIHRTNSKLSMFSSSHEPCMPRTGLCHTVTELLLCINTKSGTCSRLRRLLNCRVAPSTRHGIAIVHGSCLQWQMLPPGQILTSFVLIPWWFAFVGRWMKASPRFLQRN
jgi:hypothetical protein